MPSLAMAETSNIESTPSKISWKTLKKITFEKCEVENNGHFFMYDCAIYPPEIHALDGKRVVMAGYIYPYEIESDNLKFFWGPYAMACPYCDGIPYGLLTVANFQNPIEHTFEKVTISARLELSRKDLWGLYHRFEDAEIISE